MYSPLSDVSKPEPPHKAMRILFVHEVSYLKKPIFEMHEFPEFLASRGYEVHFLEFDEGRKFWRRRQTPANHKIVGRIFTKGTIHLHHPFQLGIPGIDRILAIFTVLPTLVRLFRANRFDAVVLYAVPTYGPQTIWVSKVFRTPVMFRAIDVPNQIRRTVVSPIIRVIERYVYRHSSLIAAHNSPLLQYCHRYSNVRTPGLIVDPTLNCEEFRPVTRDPDLARRFGLTPTDRVLLYMGTFFDFSGLPEALTTFAARAPKNVKILLVGEGSDAKRIKSTIEQFGLSDRVILHRFVPYQEMSAVIALADIALNTL